VQLVTSRGRRRLWKRIFNRSCCCCYCSIYRPLLLFFAQPITTTKINPPLFCVCLCVRVPVCAVFVCAILYILHILFHLPSLFLTFLAFGRLHEPLRTSCSTPIGPTTRNISIYIYINIYVCASVGAKYFYI